MEGIYWQKENMNRSDINRILKEIKHYLDLTEFCIQDNPDYSICYHWVTWGLMIALSGSYGLDDRDQRLLKEYQNRHLVNDAKLYKVKE